MKAKELRKLSDENLNEKLKALNLEMARAKIKLGTQRRIDSKKLGIKAPAKRGVLTSLQKQIRREIARIKTILNERK